jgi:protein-arginine kinase activator protein McsA
MAAFQMILPLDNIQQLTWFLARSACPRPGEKPCAECYEELNEQILDFTPKERYSMVQHQNQLLLELSRETDSLDTLNFRNRVREIIRSEKNI